MKRENERKSVPDIAQKSFSYIFFGYVNRFYFFVRSLFDFFFPFDKISRDLKMKEEKKTASGVKFNVSI